MITIIYQFKHNVTWHCRVNQFFSFPEQLQIWIYVFLVGDHRYVCLQYVKSTVKTDVCLKDNLILLRCFAKTSKVNLQLPIVILKKSIIY